MDSERKILPLGLTFDDVLLIPGYADFSRDELNLSTRLSRNITLEIPFVSSPMDTVTESKLAIALAQLGGIGIIHRNLTIADQAAQIRRVKDAGYRVGAAIGASKGAEERVEALVKAQADVIVVDSAHGYSRNVIDTTRMIKKNYPNQEVIAGNIATGEGAEALIQAGVDGLRLGMGPGAICTTRIVSGMGVPQITAILDVVKVTRQHGDIPIIADGGIRYSGDMIKALAAGASSLMMGSFFASTEESPGKIVELYKNQVPSRFQSIIDQREVYKFKEYRGMGSVGAMHKGAKVKSEDEYHGKNYADRVLVAEGVEGLVPIKGTVKQLIDQAIGGIISGMFYIGARNIKEIHEKARFMQITQASLQESHPHDVLITNPGKNY